MVIAEPKPPNHCMNCRQVVYETPAEHMATCLKPPKYMKDGLPYLIPLTEAGDDAPF